MNMKIYFTTPNFSVLLLLTFSLFTPAITFSQAGEIDPTFNALGYLVYNPSPEKEAGNGIVALPDGKILVCGEQKIDGISTMLLMRLNNDGSFDDDFGTDGVITSYVGDSNAVAYDIIIQEDGKILISGYSWNTNNTDIAILRFNSDGTPDTEFGGDGIVQTDFGKNESAQGLAIQEDGKIVILSTHYEFAVSYDFLVARYNSDGTLDNTFDSDGWTAIDFIHYDNPFAMAIQDDGKIVVAGQSVTADDEDYAIARLNTNGSLDASFSGDGKLTLDNDGYFEESFYGLAIYDGNIFATGYYGPPTEADFVIYKFNDDGSLDDSYGDDGIAIADFSGRNDYSIAIYAQEDGKMLLAGSSAPLNDGDIAMARINTDGTLDESFSGDGKFFTDFDSDVEILNALTLQNDNKIVVVGRTGNAPDFGIFMARYLNDLEIGILSFEENNNSVFIYPNPINNFATLNYTLLQNENISITIKDLHGNIVSEILNAYQNAGEQSIPIPFPENISKGIYFIEISTGKGKQMIKVFRE